MIITNNEGLLRLPCEDASIDEIGSIIETLENELFNSNRLGIAGIGLAASQIGLYKKVAIVRLKDFKINLVNCHLQQGFDSAIFRQEGCLSFPGRVEDTIRFQEAHIINNLGYPNNFIVTGLTAVCCQHEIDHFNSILFMDHKNSLPLVRKKKVGPNDPCPCGKIDPKVGHVLKVKKCCGKI